MLTPYLRFVLETINSLLKLIIEHVKVRYFVYDGAFGHNDALQMVKQLDLHLISKLRDDSALYFPYQGPYAGRGQRKKYGSKLDSCHLPATAFKASSVEEDIETHIYQMQVWHKKFADLLNVVVMVKINLKTQAIAHVVLFSSDLDLPYDQLIDYYRLRFQLEFNFRDAKQYLVAYLRPADNVSRPLPYRLRYKNQPVLPPPNGFSAPRSTLLACM